MRVGNAQPFKNALRTAVLPPAAMQRVEDDIRAIRSKLRRKIRTRVQLCDLIPLIPQCGSAACWLTSIVNAVMFPVVLVMKSTELF